LPVRSDIDSLGNNNSGKTNADFINSPEIVPTKTKPVAGDSLIFSHYLYENLAGTNDTISQQWNKGPGGNALDKVPHAAYLLVNGSVGDDKWHWRIYLGKNNTTNFNVERNCRYLYLITLHKGYADTRVTYDPAVVVNQFIGIGEWGKYNDGYHYNPDDAPKNTHKGLAYSNIFWQKDDASPYGGYLAFYEDSATIMSYPGVEFSVPANVNARGYQGIGFRWGSLVGAALNIDTVAP
jgi:hypothetical protein